MSLSSLPGTFLRFAQHFSAQSRQRTSFHVQQRSAWKARCESAQVDTLNSNTLIRHDRGDGSSIKGIAAMQHGEEHGLELVTGFAGDELQSWLDYSLQGRGCSLQILQELLLWGPVSWAVT